MVNKNLFHRWRFKTTKKPKEITKQKLFTDSASKKQNKKTLVKLIKFGKGFTGYYMGV